MKKNKSFIVIGLGQFGLSLVKTLAGSNLEVLAIDADPKKLEEVSSLVLQGACCNPADPEALKQLGVNTYDCAIITFGHKLNTSALTVMQLKDMGVNYVIAKATTLLEARLLKKVGADRVILPDSDMGTALGIELISDNLRGAIPLGDICSVLKVYAPAKWVGKSLVELGVRNKYDISIIGVQKDTDGLDLKINPSADYVIKADDVLLILGENEKLEAIAEMDVKVAEIE